METFLFVNGAQLIATDDEVAEFALGVASNEIDRPMCAEFLRRRVMRSTWNEEQVGRWVTRMPPEERVTVTDIFRSASPGDMRFLRIYRALAQGRPGDQ